MQSLQIGLDAAVTWAVTNSDPANFVLLALVYQQLRKADREIQLTVDKMAQRIEDLHNTTDED